MKTNTLHLAISAVLTAGLLLAAQAVMAAGGKGAAGVSKTFTVSDSCKIAIEGNASATLADVKVGDHVGIKYTEANGTLTADGIHVMAAGQKPPAGGHHGGKGGTPAPSSELHAHGQVTAVDAAAKTITIEAKEHHGKKAGGAPAQ